MNKVIAIAILFFGVIATGHAAVWEKLQEDSVSKLMLDKQSVLEVDRLKRAWIKIVYKVPQINIEVADKTYNLSKLLWFFDCATQKAATSQVFQFSNDDLIYSAAVDAKMAKFIEPVPETDIDIAMRYVCEVGVSKAQPPEQPKVDTKKPNVDEGSDEVAAEVKSKEASLPETPSAESEAKQEKVAKVEKETKAEKEDAEPIETPKPKTKAAIKKHWSYNGKLGPEYWGGLTTEYEMCDTGRNQSPINIDKTVHAVLKPLKTFQRFPAYDIVNNGHTIQVNFKQGNMLVLDSVLYHMRQVHFHSPSENTIKGKNFPLEAHFVHEDAKGSLTVLAVMFEEGKENKAIARLWQQAPKKINAPSPLKSRTLPSELIPKNNSYYRFSGSLTTPPCNEGVSWVLMKAPMTASKEQIEAFKKIIQHDNNRPVQALNGRMVAE